MHALARNPEYRPESAAAFAEELAAASPEPPTRPLPKPTGVEAAAVATPSTEVKTEVVSHPGRRDFALPRGRPFWLALGVVVAAIGLIIGFAIGDIGGDSSSSPPPQQPGAAVEPVQDAPDFATRARNLAEWLRENSG